MAGTPERAKMPATSGLKKVVVAVSGGPDSVYLLRILSANKEKRIVVGHVNYGTRGTDSEKDQKMVEKICEKYGYDTDILVMEREGDASGSRVVTGPRGAFPAGFEKKARDTRYRFLKVLSDKVGAEAIALAHTADDQVETILMRVFEGAGIGGLKGIPREAEDGIVRPILDVWKEEIHGYLKKRKIPYRIDRSNFDTRFERNWIRHVLIPLLEKRYGKAIKKRIFTLGERFRELDDYLEAEATRWIRWNAKTSPGRIAHLGATKPDDQIPYWKAGDGIVIRRKTYSALPSVLRVKILQRICFDRLGVAPNERLLKSMDKSVSNGGPSARVNVGEGWSLTNRYEEALFVAGENGVDRKSARSGSVGNPPVLIEASGEYRIPLGQNACGIIFVREIRGRTTLAQAKRLAAKGDAEMFDASSLKLPLTVRPLRVGDRIRPFGGQPGKNAVCGEKKVKEILIDRKIPRDGRWGRPVVCDVEGAILWIPGVLRSAHAPVAPETRKAVLLRLRAQK